MEENTEGSKEPGVGGQVGGPCTWAGGTNHQRPPDLVDQMGVVGRKWKSLEQLQGFSLRILGRRVVWSVLREKGHARH